MKLTILLVILAIFILSPLSLFLYKKGSFGHTDGARSSCAGYVYEHGTLVHNGTNFLLDIADTEGKRTCGLSYRKEIKENEGMIFIFEYDDRFGIWMKDMNFPIDILWLDKEFQVLDFVSHADPDSYPRVFLPREEAHYVVELSSGAVVHNKVSLSTRFSFFRE